MIIAQISDTHIGNTGAETNLQRAVNQLLQLPALPDVVIISGDLAHNGRAEEYARFQELLAPLTMPVYVIPGNHDNRVALQQAIAQQGTQQLDGFVQYVVDLDPLLLIALDTNVPGGDGGELDAPRLQWLEDRLAEAPDRPTLIFMHHPPFVTGMQAFDNMGLAGADAFGVIVERHPQIERIVAGHLHVAMTARYRGTIAMTAASLGETMVIDTNQPDKLVVTAQPPTFLLHTWQPMTGFFTYTCQIGVDTRSGTIYDQGHWLV